MPTVTCPPHDELAAYAVGRLSEEESSGIAAHLRDCSDCQAELATLDDRDDTFVAQLRGGLGGNPILDESECRIAVDRARAVVQGAEAFQASLPKPSLGSTLGEYELIEELGHGGMGTVYKALQTKLDRVVAVKILPRSRGGDPKAISRFEREMKAIGRLAHANIVQAYDAREIDDMPVLIMEFIDGQDLAELVRRVGPLPVAEACELIRRTALALEYAHEHGLVHRDIKPSNIMLAKSGEVKLLDLGLARFFVETSGTAGVLPLPLEEMTGSGQAMGTADYMAPEQATDSRTVNIRADIYSTGCTLYKLLSGHAPFSGPAYRGTLDKMNAHVRETPPPLSQFVSELPEALAKIVARMLAKNPADRPATPAEVATALEPFCEGANLRELIAKSVSLPAEYWAKAEKSHDANCFTPRTAALPNRRRPIARNLLIGMGFFGAILLAFGAGIIITIEKNAQKTKFDIPPGSTAKVNESGELDVTLPSSKRHGETPLADPNDRYNPEVRQGSKRSAGKSEPSPRGEDVITIFSLQYADAESMVKILKDILNDPRMPGRSNLRMSLYSRNNQIIAKGDPETMRIVEALLKQLDKKDIGNLYKVSPPSGTARFKPAEKQEEAPLSQAVKEINAILASNPNLQNARPVTEDEVISAVQKVLANDHRFSPKTVQGLKSLVESRKMLAGIHLELRKNSDPIELTIVLKYPIGDNREDSILIRSEKNTKPRSFKTAKITRGNIASTIAASGTIQPEEVVDVPAQVGGRIVAFGPDPRGATDPKFKDKFIDYNTPVKKGDLLAKIDDADYESRVENEQAGVNRSKAELNSALAKMKLAQAELETARQANEKVPGSIPAAALNTLAANNEVARAAVAAAEATVAEKTIALDLAKRTLALTEIKSPIDGVVIARRVNQGQYVSEGKKNSSLFLIAKGIEKMEIWAEVKEADIGRIREGMDATFTVQAFPNEVIKAKVTQIRRNDQKNQTVVTYTVVVSFDNSEKKLLPYMTAKVRFEATIARDVLRVPNEAVEYYTDSSGTGVWFLRAKFPDGQAVHALPIQTAQTGDTMTEVRGNSIREGLEVLLGNGLPTSENPFKPVDRKRETRLAARSTVPDEQAIQGTWEVVGSTFKMVHRLADASDLPPEEIQKSTRLAITADRIKIFGEHVVLDAAKYQLNPETKPKKINFAFGSSMWWGIYKCDGDELKICESGFPFPSRRVLGGIRLLRGIARFAANLEGGQCGRGARYSRHVESGKALRRPNTPGGQKLVVFGNDYRSLITRLCFTPGRTAVISPNRIKISGDVSVPRELAELTKGIEGAPDNAILVHQPFEYALDATCQPKRLGLNWSGVFGNCSAIYKLEDDRLTVCLTLPDGQSFLPPPKTFTPGSHTILVEFKRLSPKPADAAKPSAAAPPAKTQGKGSSSGKNAEKPAPADVPVRVTVVHPQIREFTPYGDFTGRIEAANLTEVRSKIAGRIRAVHCKNGAMVKEGELLAELDDAKIIAPCSGRIRFGDGLAAGKAVTPDDKNALATIYAPDSMYVAFDVDENTVMEIRRILRAEKEKATSAGPNAVGPKVEADAHAWYPAVSCQLAGANDFRYRGKVESTDVALSPETGCARWRATLANPENVLLPGMFVRVHLETGPSRKVCFLPDPAIRSDQNKKLVYLVDDRNQVERRFVKLGQLDGEMRVIEDGLTEKDRVISDNLNKLQEGMRVTPQAEQAPPPPADRPIDKPAGAKLPSANGAASES